MSDTARWQPWSDAEDNELKKVRGVCFDVDDTFSSDGQITDAAYSALWGLRRAGFTLVPVTGRPAGWCDHFARFWPVDAVVGENGAFVFFMDAGSRGRLDTPCDVDRAAGQERLAELEAAIRARFPQVRMASDQDYREYDLAVDVYEDVEPWSDEDVDELLRMARSAGAHAKLSSVHVNMWFGDFDKFRGFTNWLANGAPGATDAPAGTDEWIYLGDSPNDEPMFDKFERCVGVANVLPYREHMQTGPRWVTASESGAGFVEVAERLMALRRD